ncbi:hypothetical protein JET14_02750 [Martelella lutilitoris]|uniref:Uncharacterized protein n=1 Tax=Martelella lutilitoris TaxID=2583532 RepID=A0A7T7HL31_9HYPH|nr:hypothetical protein [Martelella lutilitoris]QQM31117.1 hypothetical protein JET14_02750 [Martelella lutilitoris]
MMNMMSGCPGGAPALSWARALIPVKADAQRGCSPSEVRAGVAEVDRL